MSVVTSPVFYLIIFALAGMVALIGGVCILAGAGWAMIAGGCLSLCSAALLARGLTDG